MGMLAVSNEQIRMNCSNAVPIEFLAEAMIGAGGFQYLRDELTCILAEYTQLRDPRI